MGQLLVKHGENFKAAELLINRMNLLSPSVHCAYYSCVQLMLEIIGNDFGLSESRILSDAKKSNMGTHAFAINLIGKDLFSYHDFRISRVFNNTIQSLKRKREISDYTNFKLEKKYCHSALDEATKILELLFKIYTP